VDTHSDIHPTSHSIRLFPKSVVLNRLVSNDERLEYNELGNKRIEFWVKYIIDLILNQLIRFNPKSVVLDFDLNNSLI
jgi:hypothetical protein